MGSLHETDPAGSNETLGPAPLPCDALHWRCDPASIQFDSTVDVPPIAGVVGQDDAMEALRFGLATSAAGQNVFVRGLTGTGRMTLIKRLMEDIQPSCPLARDRCCVHNFAQADRPRVLTLPRGRGTAFGREMDRLADFIRDDLGGAMASDDIKSRRAALEASVNDKLEQLIKPFNQAVAKFGLALVTLRAGSVTQIRLFPVLNGKPITPEAFEKLRTEGQVKDEQYEAMRRAHADHQQDLAKISEQVNQFREEHEEAITELQHGAARSILESAVRRIEAAFPESGVHEFLNTVVEDVVHNRLEPAEKKVDFSRLYRVNVVLEHKSDDSCPIIIENTPTMRNLLGSIDFDFTPGHEPRSSHMGIRAGSLLRADGGYLIIEARDLISEPGAWKVLVRTLRTGRLEIVPPDVQFPWTIPSLKPEPIDLQVKVILLGDAQLYAMLDAYDADFPHLFKVLADFDTTIPRDQRGVDGYAGVLARIAHDEKLLPFDRTAIAAMVEYGARVAAQKGKITARFGRVADVAREAAFLANQQHHPHVAAADVRDAHARSKRRADLPARRFRQLVADGTIRVQTRGRVVGQVNGLAVLQAGPLSYGFPARITATIGPGTAGVINIEREAALSGAIHTKGFYILGGLLRWLLRTDHPLAFNASVAFEQSYGGIDGDSASGAEICCLLSALTDVPLRQDLAMTGAIDQLGHILPIGSVNEKIEGFYDACRETDATDTQGVIIPKVNAHDLVLREDVVDACRAGQFHVYAVETVHEALALFTGMPAGSRDGDSGYPDKSLLGIAVKRAGEYWLKAGPHIPHASPGTTDEQ